jgi:hypothetical protein
MARIVPSAPSASNLQGVWFVFEFADQHFALWIASITGMEQFFVNGVLTAQRRKIALSSTHEVLLGSFRYKRCLSIKSIRQGIFQCVLHQNDLAVAGLETEYVVRRKRQRNVLTIVGTFICSYLALSAQVSWPVGLAGIAAVLAVSLMMFGHSVSM